MRRLVVGLLALALTLGAAAPARADNILWLEANQTSANVTVPTTTETVAVTSNAALASARPTVRVLVIGWCQIASGTGTTTITPRIRRGTATTGALVGTANAETPSGAAGTTSHYLVVAFDTQANVDNVQYSLSVQQAGATTNGTVFQAGMLVIVFA